MLSLLEKLQKEWPSIRKSPWSFAIVCTVTIGASYGLIQNYYHDKLADSEKRAQQWKGDVDYWKDLAQRKGSERKEQCPPAAVSTDSDHNTAKDKNRSTTRKTNPPSISQEGKNNIAQVGNNNSATINPDVNFNRPVRVYDCVGYWRSSGPSAYAANEVSGGGDTKAFENMAQLNNTGDFDRLIPVCEQYMKEVPDWLTPYLFCGLGELGTGHKAKARELLKYYEQHVGPTYSLGQCPDIVAYLHSHCDPH